MSAYNDLSSDQRYAISKIMDGLVSLIGEVTYSNDTNQNIAAAIAVMLEEHSWVSIDQVIEELNKYKEEQP